MGRTVVDLDARPEDPTVETAEELPQPEKPRKPGAFAKNDPRINRSGRPRGARNRAAAWRDALWGYEHRAEDRGNPLTAGACLWWYFAHYFPDELEEFLQ